MKYFPAAAVRLFTSKNEQVKQIRVNFYLFKNSNVNSVGIVDSFFNISSKFFLNICPIFQQVCESPMQKTKSAAVQATDERPMAHPYLRQISVNPAFFSSSQKDDSHWVLNPGCMVDVVTPLSPGCPQSPQQSAAPYGKI